MQAEIFSQAIFSEPMLLQFGRYEVCLFTTKSPFKDTGNEDSMGYVLLDENHLVLVVADGAGGHPKGEEASKTVVETVIGHVSSLLDGGKSELNERSIRKQVIDGIEDANEFILKSGSGAKTTVSVCAVSRTMMRTFQVGDSGVIHTGQKGYLKFKSHYHSPVGYGVASGIISERDALIQPNLNEVYNLVGDPTTSIEIGPKEEINVNDSIIVASDGLLDNFTTDQIAEIIRKNDLLTVSKQLSESHFEEKRRESFKYDDLTFALVRPRS